MVACLEDRPSRTRGELSSLRGLPKGIGVKTERQINSHLVAQEGIAVFKSRISCLQGVVQVLRVGEEEIAEQSIIAVCWFHGAASGEDAENLWIRGCGFSVLRDMVHVSLCAAGV